MARLAFTTFAIMHKPYGDPMVQEFDDRTPDVFLEAEKAPGFIARAREVDLEAHLGNFERDWGDWGAFKAPRFYDGGFDTATDTRASTLSLWVDVAAVRRFAFGGLHREALKRRHLWFRKPDWPTYAMWWVDDEHIPTWTEACERLEHLYDHGPGPRAFNFHAVFGPSDEG